MIVHPVTLINAGARVREPELHKPHTYGVRHRTLPFSSYIMLTGDEKGMLLSYSYAFHSTCGETRRLAATTQSVIFELKYRTKSTCDPCWGLNDTLGEGLDKEAIEVDFDLFNKAEAGL